MTSAPPHPVAIVTGASAGIGQAIVRRLAEGGFRLIIVARTEVKLERLAADLRGQTEIATLAADVTAAETAGRAVQLAMERFDRLDHLISNAGPSTWAPIHKTDDALLEQILDTSLKSSFRFARESLKVMRSGSSIINVGSTYGIVGGMLGGIYCAAKAGLSGLSRAIAADYGAKGIRSNVVAPGVVRTAMTDAAWDTPAFQRSNQEVTPMDRDGTAADVANLCHFLASEEGSFINGQTIAVDGGWSTTKFLCRAALTAERLAKE